MKKIKLSDLEWKKKLSPEAYAVLREKKAEKAFSGPFAKFEEKGTYVCAGCSLPLFSSEAKYNAGTGFPSFSEPLDIKNLEFREDVGFFTKRIEVLCCQCEGHLGHLFSDGAKGKKRYSINSAALAFIPEKTN